MMLLLLLGALSPCSASPPTRMLTDEDEAADEAEGIDAPKAADEEGRVGADADCCWIASGAGAGAGGAADEGGEGDDGGASSDAVLNGCCWLPGRRLRSMTGSQGRVVGFRRSPVPRPRPSSARSKE
jgi:hypothetical protein